MLLFLLVSSVLVTGGLTQNPCPSGWVYFFMTGKCMLYNLDPVPYSAARIICSDEGGQVAMIKNEIDEQATLLVTGHSTDPMWIGITNPNLDGNFVYADGTPLGAYNAWPLGHATDQMCVKRKTSTGIGYWFPTECSQAFPVLCEAIPVYSCAQPSRWVLMNKNKCVMAYKGRRRFTFSKARSFCQSMGGELATDITSRIQRRAVAKLMRFSAHFWIGYEDIDADGKYMDVLNGQALTDRKPFKKYPPGPGKCLSFKRGKFFPKKCHRKQFVICQRPANVSF